MDQNTEGRPPYPFSDNEWARQSVHAGEQQSNDPQANDQQFSNQPFNDQQLNDQPFTEQQPSEQPAEPLHTERLPYQAYADGYGQTQAEDAAAFEPPTMEAPVSAVEPRAPHANAGRAHRVARTSAKSGGYVKSLLVGLLGGAVSAAAVTLALNTAGITGTSTRPSATVDSAAGQTVSITADTEDITVPKAVASKVLPSVVSVYVSSAEGEGLGSGAILDTDGNIITNYHVVEGAKSISVTINGKSYDATLVGTDASSDLAVVHAELGDDKVTPIEIGDSDALVVGDWVMTIGSPFGLDQSVSAGIVSSLSRNQLMTGASGNTLYTNLIQTDASINPGNSGGPLVNAEGKLVGIDTLFSSDTESFAGIGFAIPGNYAIDVANKIITGEQVTHAYIGLSMQTVNAQNAQQYHLSVNQGAYVAEVAKGGPAEKAGIEEGDIIIALGDEEITSADGMILAVRSHKIGETVKITYMRGTEEMTSEVTFGEDTELQKLQQEELEQQEREQNNGIESPYGERRDFGEDISYEDIFNYFFNNRR